MAGFEAVVGLKEDLAAAAKNLAKPFDRSAPRGERARLQKSCTELRQELGRREKKLFQGLLAR
jgi:hypothetical protein